MKRQIKLYLSFLFLPMLVTPGKAQLPKEAHRVDFFLGEWEIKVVNQEDKTIGVSRTVGRYILERRAIQSDYFALDKQGRSIFRGTTIRTYVPSSKHWVVHWAMANLNGYTYLQEEWVEGELHASGHGEDGGGKFLERYKYFDISLSSYTFEMERSYDGGKTWKFYNRLYAKRRDKG